MSVRTGFICSEWHMTDEGREVMMSVVHRNRRKKRSFGIYLPQQIHRMSELLCSPRTSHVLYTTNLKPKK